MTAIAPEVIDLDGLVGEPVCHLYAHRGAAAFSHCGVPRAEQPQHGRPRAFHAAICPDCGLRRCPTCLRLSHEAQR